MFRSTAERSFTAGLRQTAFSRTPIRSLQPSFTSQLCTLASKRAQLPALTKSQALILRQRYATKGFADPDYAHEKEVGKRKLTPHPELVSATSSVHSVFSEVGQESKKNDTDMSAGIRGDFNTIRETFSLQEVPRQSLYLGLAGLIPYLGTSLGTVLCSYEINVAHEHGTGYIMDEQQAYYVLSLLEPLQVGYGAVIISFLGAIHWGLEWAKFGGVQGYPRMMIGVVAPAVAWPTILLPHTAALITQFLAFNMLYYVDSRATRRGWTPPWYGTYRFVLTFVVGASIVVSLIGQGEISHKGRTMPTARERVTGLHESFEEKQKEAEAARTAALVKAGKDKGVKPAPAEDEEDEEEESSNDSASDEGEDKGGEEESKGDDKEDKDEGDDKDKDEGDDNKEEKDDKKDEE